METAMILLYASAESRISVSPPIQTGICLARAKYMADIGIPNANTIMIAWRTNVLERSISPAPTLRAIIDVNPTPSAMTTPFTSIFGDWLMETEVVATAPMEPTIAVSTACTREVSTCSRKIGHAKIKIVIHGLLLSSTIEKFFFFISLMSFLLFDAAKNGFHSQVLNLKRPFAQIPNLGYQTVIELRLMADQKHCSFILF